MRKLALLRALSKGFTGTYRYKCEKKIPQGCLVGQGDYLNNRWFQLGLGVLAMVMVANLQYGWTLFVNPLSSAHGWTKTQVQFAFTLFVLFQVWLVPVTGYLVDRYGPRIFVAIAGVLVAASWLTYSRAETLPVLYLGAVLGGVGAGIVYGTMIGAAVKNFPDRRGMAAGLTAAGFGGGAALTVIPISHMIKTGGYAEAFQTFGLIQGIAIVVVALFMQNVRAHRPESVKPPRAIGQTRFDRTPLEMLSTPNFYLLYVMFVLIATGLLFMTAQLGPLAADYGVAKLPVSFFGATFIVLELALIVDNVLNGASRIVFGYISDFLGRERTMFAAFSIEAAGLLGLAAFAANPVLFIVFAGMTFVASGEIYSLFPAACTDLFGTKYATTNAGLLYTAKGTAAFVVPLASSIYRASGSWTNVLVVLAAFNVIVAVAALLLLKPLRERTLAAENVTPPLTAPQAAQS
jgi:OFA family oxalate/formate antiporter-like MFS transporter